VPSETSPLGQVVDPRKNTLVCCAMDPPVLSQLYLAIHNFREAMESDLSLTDFDRICLENYISLLEITYIEWKRRNVQNRAA
jgi:hypothetical protein